MCAELETLREQVAELEEANKLLEADASRYRKLKALATTPQTTFTLAVSEYDPVNMYWNPCFNLDKAIDEAMENNNEHN